MKVINDLVGFDNLKIVQNKDYFNFSLESVILPSFCILSGNMKILDLCTGNGPIPIILSTMTDSKIIGVEVQKEVYDLAIESVNINNLGSRIEILNMDVRDLFNKYESDSFDLITCNPPYFKVSEDSNLNDNRVKSIARHEIMLNIDDILKVSQKLLKNNGKLVLVHRTERFVEILNKFSKYNLAVKRIRFIYPKVGENSNLFLMEASKNGKCGVKIMDNLYCHNDDGSYSQEVLDMFRRNK